MQIADLQICRSYNS